MHTPGKSVPSLIQFCRNIRIAQLLNTVKGHQLCNIFLFNQLVQIPIIRPQVYDINFFVVLRQKRHQAVGIAIFYDEQPAAIMNRTIADHITSMVPTEERRIFILLGQVLIPVQTVFHIPGHQRLRDGFFPFKMGQIEVIGLLSKSNRFGIQRTIEWLLNFFPLNAILAQRRVS